VAMHGTSVRRTSTSTRKFELGLGYVKIACGKPGKRMESGYKWPGKE